MCGGLGTRLDRPAEKPLVEVAGEPMVDRVVAALADGGVDDIHAAVTPAVPATRDHLDGRVDAIETPGRGYVEDLRVALGEVPPPVVTVVADLPLLAPDHVDDLLAAAAGASTRVGVPARLARALGCRVDYDREWLATGLNYVANDGDRCDGERFRSWDARLAVNVNHERDLTVAEELVAGGP
jgi:adenosylcobinamide-phosphate guanylyltransferase